MIRFANVTKIFGAGPTQVYALRDLSLDIPARQFCTIMGPSGSGKSTVLHLVAALTKPTAGEIFLADRPLSRMTERDAALTRRRELGFIFQFFHLIHYLDAEENVALPLLLDGHSFSALHFVDRDHGWAAGTGVVRTVDGGEHWTWAVRGDSEHGYLGGDPVQAQHLGDEPACDSCRRADWKSRFHGDPCDHAPLAARQRGARRHGAHGDARPRLRLVRRSRGAPRGRADRRGHRRE